MVSVRNIQPCSPGELHDLKAHLSTSNVPQLVRLIESGAAVDKGEISPLAEVGQLPTIFKNIGTVRSEQEYGQKTFRVSQVPEVLQKAQCTDRAMRQKIDSYKKEVAEGTYRLTVTLLQTDGDFYIWDGDKSAVACFEHASQTGNARYSLPVFVIRPPVPLRAVETL
jgi:hypothetical protein